MMPKHIRHNYTNVEMFVVFYLIGIFTNSSKIANAFKLMLVGNEKVVGELLQTFASITKQQHNRTINSLMWS